VGEGSRGLALSIPVSLPTGSAADLHGDASLSVEPRLLLELGGDRLRVDANLGYLVRKQQSFLTLTASNELRYGAGLAFAVVPDRLALLGEVFGGAALGPGADMSIRTLPLEGNVAARLLFGGSHAITLGGGPGITIGYGTPAWRAFLGYSFTPVRKPPPSDRDGDGLADDVDRCPDQAEDRDGFQDEDGCPDPDNDNDGIADANDRCPNEPEDKDGFQDGDGCADPDNDGDGIPDAKDRCPNDAEDKDSFQDDDGCPDPDNDGDGLLDANDRCVNEPETKNDFQDDDGCPDKKPEVKIVDREIVFDKVYFDTGTANLKPESRDLLKVVAGVIKEHPEITRLRVGGHTDSKGTPAKNLVLSKDRAAAVKAFLIEQGVEEKRLVSEGYGQTRPIASNATPEGREKNRRVQFTILEINGKPAPVKVEKAK
jgi:outer membrane protein OmpA-like peptidoglycan-associated protein